MPLHFKELKSQAVAVIEIPENSCDSVEDFAGLRPHPELWPPVVLLDEVFVHCECTLHDTNMGQCKHW